MAEPVKGIFITQKEPGQDAEDFGAIVCNEYLNLLENYLNVDSTNNLLLKLVEKAKEMKIINQYNIAIKVDYFYRDVIDRIIEMSLTRDELPVPDNNYFLDLNKRFEESDKSETVVKQLLDELGAALDLIYHVVEIYYNGGKINTIS